MEDNVLLNMTADASPVVAELGTVDEAAAGTAESLVQLGQAGAESAAQIAEAMAGAAASVTEMASTVTDAVAQLSLFNDATAGGVAQLGLWGNALEGGAAAAGAAGAATENLGAQQDAATGVAKNLSDAMKQAGVDVSAVGDNSTITGYQMLFLVGILTRVVTGFLSMGTSAQDALNVVAAMTGTPLPVLNQQLGTLENDALMLGVSMTEVGQALYYVISAGYGLTASMQIMIPVLEVAKASGADFGQVANVLTGIMKAYGASANQATQYSNMLIQVVVYGKTTMDQLATSLGRAASEGSAMGFSFQQVGAAVATLTEFSIPARQATMDLDAVMRAIGGNGDVAAASAKKLGLSFNQTYFDSLPLIGRLEYLAAITGGVNTPAFIKLVGGANAWLAAETLLKDGATAYTTNLLHMKDAQGATTTAFETSEQRITAGFQHIGAALSVFALNIVMAISPVVIPVLDAVGKAFGNVANLIITHGNIMLPILLALGGLLGGVLVAGIGALVGMLAGVLAPFAGVILVAMNLATDLGILVGVVKHAIETTPGLTQKFHEFLVAVQPIGAFLAGVLGGALHLVVTILSAFFDVLGRVVGQVLSAVLPALTDFALWLQHIKQHVQELGGHLHDLATGAMNLLHEAVRKLSDAWQAFTTFISPITNAVKDALAPAFQQLGSTIKTDILPAWQGLQTSFHNVVTVLQMVGTFIVSHVGPALQFLASAAMAVIGPFIALVQQAIHVVQWFTTITPLMDLIKGILLVLAGVIGGVVLLAISAFVGALKGLVTAFGIALAGTIQFAGGLLRAISGVLQIITSVILGFFNILKDIFTGQWGKLKDDTLKMLTGMWHGVQNILGGLLAMIQGMFKVGVQTILGFGEGFVSGFLGMLGHLAGAATKPIGDLLNNIKNTFAALPGEAVQWAINMVQGFIRGLGGMLGALKNAVGDLIKKAVPPWFPHSPAEEGPLAHIHEWMPNMVNTFTQTLDASAGQLRAAAGRAAGAIHGGMQSGPGGGVPGVAGLGGGSANTLLTNILAELRASRLGASDVPSRAPAGVTQTFGSVTMNGVTDIQAMYQALNRMAGQAQENAGRGAVAGLPWS